MIYVQRSTVCKARPTCGVCLADRLRSRSASDSEQVHHALASQAEAAALQRFKKKLSKVCGRDVLNIDILHAHE